MHWGWTYVLMSTAEYMPYFWLRTLFSWLPLPQGIAKTETVHLANQLSLQSNQEHTWERDCLRCAIWALWPVRSCSETICLSFSFSIAMLLKADFKSECTKEKKDNKCFLRYGNTYLHLLKYFSNKDRVRFLSHTYRNLKYRPEWTSSNVYPD